MRLDLLRGFCVLVMVADHIGGERSWIYVVTGGNRFFTSAAEGFVLISGIVMGTVYLNVIRREGMNAMLHLGDRHAIVFALISYLKSQISATAPATSAAPMTAHSLRPVMNEPGMIPTPWKKKTTPASNATRATMRRRPARSFECADYHLTCPCTST